MSDQCNACGHLRTASLTPCIGVADTPCVGGVRGQPVVACHGFSGRCCVCQGRHAWALWEQAHPPLVYADEQQAETAG